MTSWVERSVKVSDEFVGLCSEAVGMYDSSGAD